jgi:hypothetical protein
LLLPEGHVLLHLRDDVGQVSVVHCGMAGIRADFGGEVGRKGVSDNFVRSRSPVHLAALRLTGQITSFLYLDF